jgi:sulfur carrier protein
MALTLTLNGQPRSFTTLDERSTVTDLVAELGLKSDRIALERNGDIVPRAAWASTKVADGDRVEVVHFVGGGSVG